MTESAWEFSSDWKSLRTDYPHVCLIECCIETRRDDWKCLHLALLGFRATYTRWEAPKFGMYSRTVSLAEAEEMYPRENLGREHGA
jgi:hypothetical protein